MVTRNFRRVLAGLVLTGIPFALSAQPTAQQSKSLPARSGTTAGPRPGAKVLPDPTLLDGSKFPAEKRPETGMLGEFEMAGTENAQSEKVGGQGSAEQNQTGEQNQAGAMAGGSAGGAAGQQQQGPGGGGEKPIEQNDPNAKAEGAQAAGMQGNPEAGQAGQPGNSNRPQQVAIGDNAMQIKPQASNPTVVGAQQPVGKEVPQQYDKNTPSGGKQTPSRGNQGVEKGKVMPAGI